MKIYLQRDKSYKNTATLNYQIEFCCEDMYKKTLRKGLEEDWKFCPFCKSSIKDTTNNDYSKLCRISGYECPKTCKEDCRDCVGQGEFIKR